MTSVLQLLNKFNIPEYNQVKWGSVFQEKKQGIYIVSSIDNPDIQSGLTVLPVFDDIKIELWLRKLPNLKVDGIQANVDSIKNRLAKFWHDDESILYVGKAPARKNKSGISKRLYEYFSTNIGDGGPHSGGQWIKTLKNLNDFTVYYGFCDDPGDIELKMLKYFMSNVSERSLSNLYDKNLPLPFANIKFKGNKKHGFSNQRL